MPNPSAAADPDKRSSDASEGPSQQKYKKSMFRGGATQKVREAGSKYLPNLPKVKRFRKTKKNPGDSQKPDSDDTESAAEKSPDAAEKDSGGDRRVQVADGEGEGPRRRKYDPRAWRNQDKKRDAAPPSGLLWIYLGRFKRWRKRYFVATTPGVLVYYRDRSRKGANWAISLSDANVVVSNSGNTREFMVVSGTSIFYMRSLRKDCRTKWVDHIQNSITTFNNAIAKVGPQTRKDLERNLRLMTTESGSSQNRPELSSSSSFNERGKSPGMGIGGEHLASLFEGTQHEGQLEHEVSERVGAIMASIQPAKAAVEKELNAAQASLLDLVGGLSLGGGGGASRGSAGPPGGGGGMGGVAGGRNRLARAWARLGEAIEDVVKEETRRQIELEAENAALQESLMKRIPRRVNPAMAMAGGHHRQSFSAERWQESESDDDDDDSDSDGLAPAPSILSEQDEEYYEALEVINQVDWVARGSQQAGGDAVARATSPDTGHDADVEESAPEGSESDQEDDDDDDDDDDDVRAEEGDGGVRIKLPAAMPLRRGFQLWTILKSAIGKDLSRLTLPATINEPLSAVQRLAEELEYRELVEDALRLPTSIERLARVAVFALSSYSSCLLRESKPFNPMLGETYEYIAPDKRARMLCEQVSHHPPISVFHCEGSSEEGSPYVFYGELDIKNKFWGKSVELHPYGHYRLKLPSCGDEYTWNKGRTHINNVVVGTLWVDFSGEIVVTNQATRERAVIRIFKGSGPSRGRVQGAVHAADGSVEYTVGGNFMDQIWVRREEGEDSPKQTLFRRNPPPEFVEQQYNMTRFAITLNDASSEQLLDALPPTDSRLRPDQRALEEGDLERATPEKLRLEESQRAVQKERERQGREHKVQWFAKRAQFAGDKDKLVANDPEADGDTVWEFTGRYWEEREKGAWDGVPDIYNL